MVFIFILILLKPKLIKITDLKILSASPDLLVSKMKIQINYNPTHKLIIFYI